MKITKIKTPPKGDLDFYFIAGDLHTEAMDLEAHNIMLQHAKLIPKAQRKLIINGDFLDAEFLMKRGENFKKWSKRDNGCDEFFCPMADEEIGWGNDQLDIFQNIFSEVIYIEGNHDCRYAWFMSQCAREYRHNFDLKKRLHLEDRGIKHVLYNNWIDVGHLSITHGMFHGTSAHKRHFEASGGRNVIFSHIHHSDVKCFPCRDKTKKVWSLPCMSDTNPEYIKNRDNNWEKGYGTIKMKPSGDFHVNIHVVHNGSLILDNGKEICVK